MDSTIRKIIQRIPIPFCGVVLSLASLGTLYDPIASWAHYLFGVTALVFFVAIIAKILLYPAAIAEDLENPLSSAIAGTFPMMLFGFVPHLAHMQWHAGFALWGIALCLYFVVVVRFTLKFAFKTPIDQITPAYFVVYIPILLAANTSPLFGVQAIGRGLFLICFPLTIVLLVVVSLRFVRNVPLPKPQLPLLCIYAAPASMCLTAYLTCFDNASAVLATGLYVLAALLFFAGLVALVSCLSLPFYPTYAAMTFPFVISATASLRFAVFLQGGFASGLVNLVGYVQLALATAVVLYVLVRYVQFLLKPQS